MTTEELVQARQKYPSTIRSGKHVQFDPNYHKGGTWRKGMGAKLTSEEIRIINQNFDNLTKLLQTKKFQKRPDYGTHAEAKP